MQLFVLLAVALIGGYLLAKSRVSKNIDDTANSAVSSSKSLFSKTSDRLRGKSTKSAPQGEIAAPAQEPENKTNVSS